MNIPNTNIPTPKRVRHHVNPLAIVHEVDCPDFPNTNNIIIDIWAYKGLFMRELFERTGETKNFLLFEIRPPYEEYLNQVFQGNDNFRILWGDAAKNLPAILEQIREKEMHIEEIYVNFPDPWPKEKHKKRRVVNEKFLREIFPVLEKSTKIIFQTDQQSLFEETEEIILENSNYIIEKFDDAPYGIHTFWENAKIAEGKKIWRMKFWKK